MKEPNKKILVFALTYIFIFAALSIYNYYDSNMSYSAGEEHLLAFGLVLVIIPMYISFGLVSLLKRYKIKPVYMSILRILLSLILVTIALYIGVYIPQASGRYGLVFYLSLLLQLLFVPTYIVKIILDFVVFRKLII